MEWSRDEIADIRRAEAALERLRRDLKQRGKWRWMWRIQDVQHELQVVKREVADQSRQAAIARHPVSRPIDPKKAALARLIAKKVS